MSGPATADGLLPQFWIYLMNSSPSELIATHIMTSWPNPEGVGLPTQVERDTIPTTFGLRQYCREGVDDTARGVLSFTC